MNGPNDLVARRGAFLLVFLLLAGMAILARLVELQVVRAASYRQEAQRQHERDVVLDPGRGAILDRRANLIALSVDVPSVYADPSEVTDPREEARVLAPILGLRARAIEARLGGSGYFVWLRRKVDPAVKVRLDALRLPGIATVIEAKRVYPHGDLFAHLVGAAGLDEQGLAGLEYQYDADVRGTPGRLRTLRDARGEPLLPGGLSRSEPTGGRTLVLTVDEAIQHVTVRALGEAVKAHLALGGAALTMNPATGEILSISSLPAFDPNTYPSSPPSTRRNRALGEILEPGSTLKIITAAAALEAGLGPGDRVNCGNGEIRVRNTILHDVHPYGELSLQEVIQKSSNVGAIQLGLHVGPARLYGALRAFGFGRPTGIDLPGESPGLLRPPPRWSGLSLASLSIGQEIGVTPLQMLAAVAAVANGGVLLQPYVVSEVRDPDGRIVRARGRRIVGRPLRPETARALTGILAGVVEAGTGTKARIPGYAVVGKTGTAQKTGPSGEYEEGRYAAWFAGYVPAQDPVLAAVVVIDEPRAGLHFGGDVAAPVFAEIALETLRILRVPPDRPLLPEEEPLRVARRDGRTGRASGREVGRETRPVPEGAAPLGIERL